MWHKHCCGIDRLARNASSPLRTGGGSTAARVVGRALALVKGLPGVTHSVAALGPGRAGQYPLTAHIIAILLCSIVWPFKSFVARPIIIQNQY